MTVTKTVKLARIKNSIKVPYSICSSYHFLIHIKQCCHVILSLHIIFNVLDFVKKITLEFSLRKQLIIITKVWLLKQQIHFKINPFPRQWHFNGSLLLKRRLILRLIQRVVMEPSWIGLRYFLQENLLDYSQKQSSFHWRWPCLNRKALTWKMLFWHKVICLANKVWFIVITFLSLLMSLYSYFFVALMPKPSMHIAYKQILA